MSAPTAESHQPSAKLMSSFDDDSMQDEPQAQPQRSGKQPRGSKPTRGGSAAGASSASAAAAAAGNNSSEPVLSAKAERALRKQQQAANARAHPAGRHSKSRSPSNPPSPSHSQQHRDEADRHPDKKTRMRDCEDVLNRIRHDSACQEDGGDFLSHFLIAYIDRVWGDQEISFTEFFSNSDYKDIPLHRISYIRFFDEIVWNRAARFDAVFGSSNSTKTLPDWIAEAPKLKAAQELRWAILLAQEAAEVARDQRMLSALDVQIAEQREEIDAMQNRAEVASAATSGFDFSESAQRQRMQDVEDAEIEAMEAEDALQREAQDAEDAASNDVYADAGTASAATAATAGGGVAPISSSASLLSTIRSHPPREDDANLSVRLSLFDSALGRVLRTAALRLSTEHFDWGFMRKRIASRLRIKGGARDVKRVYVQEKASASPAAAAAASASTAAAPAVARSNLKLTDSNFRALLFEGCELIVMVESESAHPQAMLREPKGGGEKMEQRDAERVAAAAAAAGVVKNMGGEAALPASPFRSLPVTHAPGTARPVYGINRDRPNWFVSLRIRSAPILRDLLAVQSSLTSYDERYASFLVPAGTFHITLSLLHIASKDEEDVAWRTMMQLQPRLTQIMAGAEDAAFSGAAAAAGPEGSSSACSSTSAAPASLSIRGLSSFGQKVLFADIARDLSRARLNRVALVMKEAFRAAQVGCTEVRKAPPAQQNKEARGGKAATFVAAEAEPAAAETAVEEEEEGFTPHLTIAKMSRAPPSGAGAKFNRGGGGGKVNAHGKGNNHVGKPLRPNMGGAEAESDRGGAASVASGSSLPANPFTALPRDNSTASNAAAADEEMTPADSGAGDASAAAAAAPSAAPLVRSTSVIRRIDRESYAGFVTHDFGSEPISSLDLCSMMARKDAQGYYAVKGSIFIDGRAQPTMEEVAVPAPAAASGVAASGSSAAAAPALPSGLCYFVCGPLELTASQFAAHYAARLAAAAADPASTFVLGIAPGTDSLALQYLRDQQCVAPQRIALHSLDTARFRSQLPALRALGHPVRAEWGSSHELCDASMAALAHVLVAWERPADETRKMCEDKGIVYRADRVSGTTKNLARKLRPMPTAAAAASVSVVAADDAAPAPGAAAAPAFTAAPAAASAAAADGRRERRVRQPL